VLEDVETAPIAEPLRETLRLLAKLTLEPERFGPDDLQEARAVGVDDDALAEAMYVCALFNIIVRCADSLDFALPAAYSGQGLLAGGYLSIMGEQPGGAH